MSCIVLWLDLIMSFGGMCDDVISTFILNILSKGVSGWHDNHSNNNCINDSATSCQAWPPISSPHRQCTGLNSHSQVTLPKISVGVSAEKHTVVVFLAWRLDDTLTSESLAHYASHPPTCLCLRLPVTSTPHPADMSWYAALQCPVVYHGRVGLIRSHSCVMQ